MSIPVATTSIQLLAPPEGTDEDWGGTTDYTGYMPVGGPVRAHLSLGVRAGAAAAVPEGSTSTIDLRLVADPCEMTEEMLVRDDYTGRVYAVDWVLQRPPPMPHVVAGLVRVIATP